MEAQADAYGRACEGRWTAQASGQGTWDVSARRGRQARRAESWGEMAGWQGGRWQQGGHRGAREMAQGRPAICCESARASSHPRRRLPRHAALLLCLNSARGEGGRQQAGHRATGHSQAPVPPHRESMGCTEAARVQAGRGRSISLGLARRSSCILHPLLSCVRGQVVEHRSPRSRRPESASAGRGTPLAPLAAVMHLSLVTRLQERCHWPHAPAQRIHGSMPTVHITPAANSPHHGRLARRPAHSLQLL